MQMYKESIARANELARQYDAAVEAAQQAKQVAPATEHCAGFLITHFTAGQVMWWE